MKRRLIVLIGLALVCLVLAGFALERPQTVESRAAEAVSAGGHYMLSGAASQPEATTLRGGGYQLAGATQGRAQDLASGGHYQLSAPAGRENGCCCNYLPCVSK